MRNGSLSSYVVSSKYAKYKKAEQRREIYPEIVDRYLSTFQNMPALIKQELRAALASRKIVGSMRGMQFGGEGIQRQHARVFNCCSSFCDRPQFFSQALYLLLCGTGVGFSVSKVHVSKLPTLVETDRWHEYYVEDSIEGWADAAWELLSSFFYGTSRPHFNFSKVRPKGAPISHGGKAPGPEPLAHALTQVAELCQANIGSKLSPLQCSDIVMHLANCVLSGGIRRSACLVAFDLDDEEFMLSKTGDWWTTNPQRARANISAIILPHHTEADFNKVFASARQFGEPGILNLPSNMYITNPCAEIGMCPVLIRNPAGETVEQYTLDMLDNPATYIEQGYTYASGWSFCNLSSVNCAAILPGELPHYAKLASILGTFQATLTSFPYLGAVSEQIAERESLLGISLTGVYSDRAFLSPGLLSAAADAARDTNKYWAEQLGISAASRICCVKPEGTASLALGVVSSGAHPYHARKYIRRVQAHADEPLYKYVESVAPSACAKSVWGDENLRVIHFACTSPDTAVTRSELSLEQHIKDVLLLNHHWVRRGEGPARCEDLHHNVSVTFSVQDGEWDLLRDSLFTHRALLTGASFLSAQGDYVYPQAPLQEVFSNPSNEAEREALELFNHVSTLPNLDLSLARELEDSTDMQGESACAGGACLVPMYEMPTDVGTAATAATADDELLRHNVELILEIAAHILRDRRDVLAALQDTLTKSL